MYEKNKLHDQKDAQQILTGRKAEVDQNTALGWKIGDTPLDAKSIEDITKQAQARKLFFEG